MKVLAVIALVVSAVVGALPGTADPGHEFFEKEIRPLLVQHCYECHGPEKQKGGLRLDSKASTLKGGDSGPSLVAGQPDSSLLIKAVSYVDADLQMPPKNRLSARQWEVLVEWVKRGAPDPREESAPITARSGMKIAEGKKFWSYQPPRVAMLPAVRQQDWPRGSVDRFILARLEEKNLHPASDADRVTLVRRFYYDLVGLPPTPAEIDSFVSDTTADAPARLVDRLLATPQFGERWGRHWLDVARFGESVTLRGLVFKEAWRYRDYVIEAFNADLPYNEFIQEQVAGDLLVSHHLDQSRRRLVATTFLALGNWNLEEQDKAQLRMDVVDEQLDTIGKTFLAQTIGCARCHDHKFDPISTRDYYALAGILRGSKTLVDANVSTWIERPLPVAPEFEQQLKAHEEAVSAVQARLKSLKEKSAASVAATTASTPSVVAIKQLPGIVVDDAQARRVGDWRQSQFNASYIGEGYLEDRDAGKGTKTLTFQPELPKAGVYEVRFAYTAGANRATNVPVNILSAEGETVVTVNEQLVPPIDGHFVSLGQYRFEQNNQGFVLIATEATSGHVIVDAIQFLPVELAEPLSAAKPGTPPTPASNEAEEPAKLRARLERELKELTAGGPKRPVVMSVREEEAVDIAVHVRGSVHNLGDVVPRGFLQVAHVGDIKVPGKKESGRRELGAWLASPENPLPARVMANRTWHWLFGAGLVRTTDNFGTTGERPSHAELLDYLAVRFMEEGWSIKRLVREIVLSRTYQLASTPTEDSLRVDPENRLWSHALRRRLDAESLRDTMLLVSGRLRWDMFGPTIKPGTASDFGYQYTETRRSVYVPVLRNALPEAFELFDFADPSMVTGVRTANTVAPQALFFLNHPFVREQAQRAAELSLALNKSSERERLEFAYRLVLGRSPNARELRSAEQFVQGTERVPLERWTQLYHALFASLDFRYLH